MKTFSAKPHEVERDIHESPWNMTVPLIILAMLSIVGGWIGIGGRFERFLEPVTQAAPASTAGETPEAALMIASVAIALAGIGLAWFLYIKRTELPDKIAASFGGLYRLVYNKYYVDQIYDALFVNRTKDLGLTLGAFDRTFIDGLGVDGTGWLTRATSVISIYWDKWIIDGSVNLVANVVRVLSIPVRWLQTGRVSSYAGFIVLGVLVLLGFYLHAAGYTLANLRP